METENQYAKVLEAKYLVDKNDNVLVEQYEKESINKKLEGIKSTIKDVEYAKEEFKRLDKIAKDLLENLAITKPDEKLNGWKIKITIKSN